MPRLNAIPKGCAYNPRCPQVFDRCKSERPELVRPVQPVLPALRSRAELRHEHAQPQVAGMVRANDLAKTFDVSAPGSTG